MPKIDGRTLDHGTSEHIRILAVRRVRKDKEKPSEVIKSLGLCWTTIYRWLRAHDKGAVQKLKSSKATGPAPKLTEKQKQKVRTWIVGKFYKFHIFLRDDENNRSGWGWRVWSARES